jgi:hypothetical protein
MSKTKIEILTEEWKKIEQNLHYKMSRGYTAFFYMMMFYALGAVATYIKTIMAIQVGAIAIAAIILCVTLDNIIDYYAASKKFRLIHNLTKDEMKMIE